MKKWKKNIDYFEGSFVELIRNFSPLGEEKFLSFMFSSIDGSTELENDQLEKMLIFAFKSIHEKVRPGTWEKQLVICFVEIFDLPKDQGWWAAFSASLKVSMGIYPSSEIKNQKIAELFDDFGANNGPSLINNNFFWNAVFLPCSEFCKEPAFYFDDYYRYSLETNRTRRIIPLLKYCPYFGYYKDSQIVLGILSKALIEDFCEQYSVALRISNEKPSGFLLESDEDLPTVFGSVIADVINKASESYSEKERLDAVTSAIKVASLSQKLAHSKLTLNDNEFKVFFSNLFKFLSITQNGLNYLFAKRSMDKEKSVGLKRINWESFPKKELEETFISEFKKEKIFLLQKTLSEVLNNVDFPPSLIPHHQIDIFLHKYMSYLEQNPEIIPYLARGILDVIVNDWLSIFPNKGIKEKAGWGIKVDWVVKKLISQCNQETFIELGNWVKKWASPVTNRLSEYTHNPRGISFSEAHDLLTYTLRLSLLATCVKVNGFITK